MAIVLGRPIERLSIIFDDQPKKSVKRRWRSGCRPDAEWLEVEVMIALAGPLAEAISRRQARSASAGFAAMPLDSHAHAEPTIEVPELVEQLIDDPDERAAFIDRVRERTENALAHRGYWEAVAAVAWALVYRLELSPSQVQHIFWSSVAAHQQRTTVVT